MWWWIHRENVVRERGFGLRGCGCCQANTVHVVQDTTAHWRWLGLTLVESAEPKARRAVCLDCDSDIDENPALAGDFHACDDPAVLWALMRPTDRLRLLSPSPISPPVDQRPIPKLVEWSAIFDRGKALLVLVLIPAGPALGFSWVTTVSMVGLAVVSIDLLVGLGSFLHRQLLTKPKTTFGFEFDDCADSRVY